MLALAEKGIKDLPLLCNLDGQVVIPLVNETGKLIGCKISTYLIDCETDSRPATVALVGPNTAKQNVSVYL